MRLHFSIRALLLLTLVSGVLLLFAHRFHSNLGPKRLVAELNAHGAQPILMDWHSGIGNFTEDKFLLEHLTDSEHYEPLVGVRLDEVTSSRALFLASQLEQCSTLDVRRHDPAVTPKHCGFEHVRSLSLGGFHDTQLLEWLDVADSIDTLSLQGVDPVDIQCWIGLGKMSRLTRLHLTDMTITWRELEALNTLPTLEHVGFYDCQLEQGVLLELRRFPNLTSLTLWGSTFDESMLTDLSHLSGLNYLSLDESNVNDSDVKELAKMTHLRHLHFYGCQRLTEACMEDLRAMEFLDFVCLLRSPIEDHPQVSDLPFTVQEWAY